MQHGPTECAVLNATDPFLQLIHLEISDTQSPIACAPPHFGQDMSLVHFLEARLYSLHLCITPQDTKSFSYLTYFPPDLNFTIFHNFFK